MGSIADKLNKIIDTKAAIRTSISNKGVTVSENDAFDLYPSKIDSISGGSEWVKPTEWPDISNVANNEINLLVSDRVGGKYSFVVTTASGTFSVDWGDTTSTTGQTSATQVYHTYSGGGTLLSSGERVYTIRIYTSGGNLTRFYVGNFDSSLPYESQGYLWAQLGTLNLTSLGEMFAYRGVRCNELERVVIPSFPDYIYCSDIFNSCRRLHSVELPSNWGVGSNLTRMFYNCYSLTDITFPEWPVGGGVSSLFYIFSGSGIKNLTSLPNPWPEGITVADKAFGGTYISNFTLPDAWPNSLTGASSLFSECLSLSKMVLPASWNNVNNVNNMFRSCYSLFEVVMPTSRSQILLNYQEFFFDCENLITIDNYEFMGSTTGDTNMSDTFKGCVRLEGTYTFDCRLSRFGFYGYSGGRLAKVTGIRLTNQNSGFGGASPQVDVQYTSLEATALNTLFGDLPALSGKTIKITGATGAATCDTSIATAKGWTVTN